MSQKIKSKNVYLVTIEITTPSYDYKTGDTRQFVIIAPSEKSFRKILDNEYCGSEYPNYKVLSLNILGTDDFFCNTTI